MIGEIDFYPVLRMQRLGDIVVLQPWWKGKSLGQSLTCDLSSGTLQLVDKEDITHSYTDVFGVLGFSRMKKSSSLIVVTDAREVGILRGFPVFLVAKTRVLSGSSASSHDRSLIRTMQDAVDPSKYGGGMFLSAGGDITLCSQKHLDAGDSASAWQRADPWLTWNRVLALPLIEAGAKVCANNHEGIYLTDQRHTVRGSIPVMWSQTPNLKYKIPISIGPSGRSEAVLKSHVSSLSKNYGAVTAINLANLTGREGRLSDAYASAAEAVSREISNFKFVPFDFHKNFGCLTVNGQAPTSRQTGVFRTNCIDTLDRTNVVQGMLARKSLEGVLHAKGLLAEGEGFSTAYPELEKIFRVIWADHGDEISRQYAGTGAMKSAFTRTGKRDLAGLLDDGVKSMTRYFLNNFKDGGKQDALDLVTGTFKSDKDGARAASSIRISPAIPLILATILVVLAHKNFVLLGSTQHVFTLEAIQKVWLLLFLAIAIVHNVKKYGKYLVDSPMLRPDLSIPWESR
eukprot:jgi/Picre1/32185/NNA_007531.t1